MLWLFVTCFQVQRKKRCSTPALLLLLFDVKSTFGKLFGFTHDALLSRCTVSLAILIWRKDCLRSKKSSLDPVFVDDHGRLFRKVASR